MPQWEPREVDSGLYAELIAQVRPESLSFSGPVPFEYFRRMLMVPHVAEAHREIEQLLDAVRRADRQFKTAQGDARIAPVFALNAKSAEEWKARFAKRISIDLNEAPLTEVARFFADKSGGPILLDEVAFEFAPFALEATYSKRLEDVPLIDALNSILIEHFVGWYLHDEVLMLAPLESAEQHVLPRIYPLGDLVLADDEDADMEQISDNGRIVLEHETWRKNQ